MRTYILKTATILILSLVMPQLGYSQEPQQVVEQQPVQQQGESLRDRLSRRKEQQEKNNAVASVPQLSVRAAKMNDRQARDLSNVAWMREVYRMLDLTKGKNAALLYPTEPIGDRMNLFALIFKLMSQGDLVAYDYLDGKEIFTDQYKKSFEDVLKLLEVPFTKQGNRYEINEMDIPGNQVLMYYVKEAWYFDASSSVLDTKIVAICPLITRVEYMEGISAQMSTGRVPLFWIPYDDIRPYAARTPMMTSDVNNAMDKTIDDYFQLKLYEGEIFKTTNMENKVLIEKYENVEDVKAAQDKIESELHSFEKNLWEINDSIKAENIELRKNKKYKEPKKSDSMKGSSGNKAAYSARDRR